MRLSKVILIPKLCNACEAREFICKTSENMELKLGAIICLTNLWIEILNWLKKMEGIVMKVINDSIK